MARGRLLAVDGTDRRRWHGRLFQSRAVRPAVLVTLILLVLGPASAAAPAGAQTDDPSDGGALVISERPVAVRGAIVRVRVSCRAARGCDGRLVLRVRGASIGTRRFDLAARRRNARVAVRVTRAGLRTIRSAGRVRVTAVASVGFGDGRRAKPSVRFWLRAAGVS